MLKYFFLLISLTILACSDGDDPQLGTWIQLKDVPYEGRAYGLSLSLLGKGYLVSGRNVGNPHLKDVWSYDPVADSWTRKKDYPFYVSVEFAVTTGGKAYVIDYTGKLYEYNPVADSWQYLSTFPGGARPGLTGFGLGGNVYFGTGNGVSAGDGYYNDFWKYDIAKNEWTQIDDFPGQARSTAFSFVIGEYAYVGLGSSAGAPPIHPDIYRYSTTTGKWNQIADFPEINFLMGISFSNNSKGYIGLAERDHGKMYEYDPSTDIWRTMTKFPSEYSVLTNSFTINDRMFVFGGKSSTYGKNLWEFIP